MGWMGEYERGPTGERDVSCSWCFAVWAVEGHYAYGTWWPERDDDMTCEDCGTEGEL